VLSAHMQGNRTRDSMVHLHRRRFLATPPPPPKTCYFSFINTKRHAALSPTKGTQLCPLHRHAGMYKLLPTPQKCTYYPSKCLSYTTRPLKARTKRAQTLAQTGFHTHHFSSTSGSNSHMPHLAPGR